LVGPLLTGKRLADHRYMRSVSAISVFKEAALQQRNSQAAEIALADSGVVGRAAVRGITEQLGEEVRKFLHQIAIVSDVPMRNAIDQVLRLRRDLLRVHNSVPAVRGDSRAERQRIGAACILHSGQGPELAEKFIQKLYAARLRLRREGRGQGKVNGDHVLGAKSRVNGKYAHQTASEQTGADQERHGDCNL